MSDKERQPISGSSHERIPFTTVVRDLGIMLRQEFNTAVADVDDPDRAGRLVISSDTRNENSHFLFTSNDAQLSDLGFLSLRAITDMVLGQMLDHAEIIYPFIGKGSYEQMSPEEKAVATSGLLATNELLKGKPLAEWGFSLQDQVADITIPYWQEEAHDKVERMRSLFTDPNYIDVTTLWRRQTMAHLRELLTSDPRTKE